MRKTVCLALLLFTLSCRRGDPPAADQPPAPAPPSGPAVELDRALYGTNAAAADEKFTGKRVLVYCGASITRVEKVSGAYCVTVSVNMPDTSAPGTRCWMARSESAKLAGHDPVHVGVVVAGTCRGRFNDPAVPDGFYVRVDDCTIQYFSVLRYDQTTEKWIEEKR